MALLRLTKESELRRDKIIGSGAFGKVYKVCRTDSESLLHILIHLIFGTQLVQNFNWLILTLIVVKPSAATALKKNIKTR